MHVDFRGVEQWRGSVFGAHQQADFGAAEDDAFCALGSQLFDGLHIEAAAAFGKVAHAELFENDAVDFGLCAFIRHDGLDAAFGQAFAVERVLHGKACAEQADGADASCADAFGHAV